MLLAKNTNVSKFLGKGKDFLIKLKKIIGEGKCFGGECKSFQTFEQTQSFLRKSKDLQADVKLYLDFLGQTFCKIAQSFLRESKSIAKELNVLCGSQNLCERMQIFLEEGKCFA